MSSKKNSPPPPGLTPQQVSDLIGLKNVELKEDVAKIPEPKVVYELTNKEDIAVAAGLDEPAKAAFVNAIRDIIELNGTGDVPGIQASYIDVSEYVQDFSMTTFSDSMKKALFLAHNWNALGKGVGGLAGAAVRWKLYTMNLYTRGREMTINTKAPIGSAALIAEYDKLAKTHKDLVNFFITNAVSVAALSGAMVNRIVHHWDAKHTGAQKAFINAMGMAEHLPDDSYRPVFYLAIHPLPLSVTEKLRHDSAHGLNDDIAEVVRLRCEGPPAGYGALNACAAAAPSLLSERFMNPDSWVDKAALPAPGVDGDFDIYAREMAKINAYNDVVSARRAALPALREAIFLVAERNSYITAHAGEYHQFAQKYGFKERKTVNLDELEPAMIILAAYIFAKIKGSLANSAAVRKFRDQNAREVQKRITAFANMDEGDDIFSLLGI